MNSRESKERKKNDLNHCKSFFNHALLRMPLPSSIFITFVYFCIIHYSNATQAQLINSRGKKKRLFLLSDWRNIKSGVKIRVEMLDFLVSLKLHYDQCFFNQRSGLKGSKRPLTKHHQ